MDDYPATQMMESTQLLDATQLLGDDGGGAGPAVVGRLEVGIAKYHIVVGDNKIGRDPKCEVFISNPSLSRTHAVVEADRDGCTVHDVRSSNGTKKGGVRLRPNVRYNLESGEQLVFGDVTAVFIAGVEAEAAADSDNDSNVSDSLFDMEDNNDGEDENIPPNFVPDTPVGLKPPVKPFSRPSLGDLSFVPESQSSPLPTSILKQQALFKVPDSPATDLDDSSFLCPSQQPVQVRERPSRLVQGSFRPGQDKTSTLMGATVEQLETSVSSDKSGDIKGTVVPDSDDEDDMFAAGTQAVNDTDDADDEAFGPTQAVNETTEEPLATQAVDETVDETITDENELFEKETPNVNSGSTEVICISKLLPFDDVLLRRVNTEDLNNLFAKANPKCESVLEADTQALGLHRVDTRAPDLLGADTQAPVLSGTDYQASDLLEADTQASDLLGVDTQAPYILEADTQAISLLPSETHAIDLMAAETQAPEVTSQAVDLLGASDLLGADTQALDLLGANTQALDLLGANTQAPDLLGANTQAPDLLEADTQAPDLLGAETQAPDFFGADTPAPDLLGVDTQVPDLLGADTQTPDLLGADTQAISSNKKGATEVKEKLLGRRKLNDSEIMCASTQALVASLSDSDLVGRGEAKQTVGPKLSDSYIMCASTQALVAGLSDSDLMGENTQAVAETSLSDSLLGSATQAVCSVGVVSKPTDGLHVVDSMDLLGSDHDDPSSCDTSADDLMMLATQPVFKLPSLPMGKGKSSPSITETNPVVDADTEPLEPTGIEDAETVLLHEEVVDGLPDCLVNKVATDFPIGDAIEEDETQCFESFTEIKDNLQAAAGEGAGCTSLLIRSTRVEVHDDEDAESDASEDLLANEEDLLANEEDLELRLDDTRNESAEADNEETSRLSNTTLSSVSMVEASQPVAQKITKGFSVNNRTDFNSMTMDQTSVVESDIVSANDDTDALSEASDNLLDDQEDLPTEESLDIPEEMPNAGTPGPVSALLSKEVMHSPVFKKRPLTPVEIALRNTQANDSKELCLLLDSSVEDSPIFRKKNSSVCGSVQNNSGLIKSLIEEEEGVADVTVEASSPASPVPPCSVGDAVENAAVENTYVGDIADTVVNICEAGSAVEEKNVSISVRRRSSTPEDVLNVSKDVSTSDIVTEIIAEVVSPAKSPDADSGPLLPETQALRVEEEEISDDELEDFELLEVKEAVKPDEVQFNKEIVHTDEEILGKGKRDRKLTPKAEELLNQSRNQQTSDDVETPKTIKNVLGQDKSEAIEIPPVKSNRRKSRKAVPPLVEAELPSPPKSEPVTKPEQTPATAPEGNIRKETEDLAETPLATVGKKLGRGKRGKRVSARVADVGVRKVVDIVDKTETEVIETQPWEPASVKTKTLPVVGEEETQPFEKDLEVLLPGQSGVEVDSYAETQPLEETINEEPIVKKSKIANDIVPPVKKSSRRSQLAKPSLEELVPARGGKRRSAVQAMVDLQPVETKAAHNDENRQIGKSRGKSLKVAASLLLDTEESEVTNKVKNLVMNKLGRRNKKLKMPSSLLIESPAADDMFVDDADRIPSPLTNGTPVIPLKTRATRKFRSKAPENEKVVDESEAIDEDEPVEKRRTVRMSRSSQVNDTANVQSVKVKPDSTDAQTVQGPSRKSIDDFSPRSKTKMEPKLDKLNKLKQGKRKPDKKISEEAEVQEDNYSDKGTDVAAPVKTLPSRRKQLYQEEEISQGVIAHRRGGRGKKAAEVETETETDEKSTEEIVETMPVVKGRRGKGGKAESVDSSVVEPERGRGRKAEPANSTVAVMEPEPVVARRGGRGRKTEPVNIESTCEAATGRRTRNTSGASTASTASTDSTKTARTTSTKIVAEVEPSKAAGGRRGRGRKDSETSIASTKSDNSEVKVKKQVMESDKPASSCSSTGSRGRKRPAEETPEGSSSKKRMEDVSSNGSVRSRLNSSMDSNASPSLRKVESLTKNKHLVMFTGYNDQNDITLVKELRGSTTDSLTKCTVLVTDQIRRTAKFLSMVGRGVPIVAPLWLTESKRSGKFLDPWDFILKDPNNEKKWGFRLEDSLRKASGAQLLDGLSIHVTGQVKPSPEQCKDFIVCGGGEFLETLPTEPVPGLHIVSCSEDKKLTSGLAKLRVPIMDKEWMLSGLLKYKLDRNLKLK